MVGMTRVFTVFARPNVQLEVPLDPISKLESRIRQKTAAPGRNNNAPTHNALKIDEMTSTGVRKRGAGYRFAYISTKSWNAMRSRRAAVVKRSDESGIRVTTC